MADGVQPVLVLGTDIALQGLQDAVGLQGGSRNRSNHWSQPKPAAENSTSGVSLLRCWTDLSPALTPRFYLIKSV